MRIISRPGSAIIIVNRSHTRFLLQQKRKDHGIPQYRGAYSLFGGSLEEGETPDEGLERELEEEILDKTIVAELIEKNTCWDAYWLKGIIYDKFFCSIFVAEINDSLFEEWENKLKDVSLITEGKAVFVSRDELTSLLQNPKLFVGSLDRVLRDWLKEQS